MRITVATTDFFLRTFEELCLLLSEVAARKKISQLAGTWINEQQYQHLSCGLRSVTEVSMREDIVGWVSLPRQRVIYEVIEQGVLGRQFRADERRASMTPAGEGKEPTHIPVDKMSPMETPGAATPAAAPG